VRFLRLVLPILLAACATPQDRAAQAEKDYGALCEKRGHAQGSEQWRACVQTEDMNAALATQQDYEQRYLRKRDCIDPKLGC
jgi:hypothetical protein